MADLLWDAWIGRIGLFVICVTLWQGAYAENNIFMMYLWAFVGAMQCICVIQRTVDGVQYMRGRYEAK